MFLKILKIKLVESHTWTLKQLFAKGEHIWFSSSAAYSVSESVSEAQILAYIVVG